MGYGAVGRGTIIRRYAPYFLYIDNHNYSLEHGLLGAGSEIFLLYLPLLQKIYAVGVGHFSCPVAVYGRRACDVLFNPYYLCCYSACLLAEKESFENKRISLWTERITPPNGINSVIRDS